MKVLLGLSAGVKVLGVEDCCCCCWSGSVFFTDGVVDRVCILAISAI